MGKYKLARNKIVKEIRNSKQEYFDKLDRLLSSDNHDPKLFWITSKQVLNLKKSSNAIPTLKMNNEFAESDQQKVEMLNHYFASQTQVDDSNKALPYLEPSPYTLESITVSRQDVEDVLQHHNVSKASGPDLISPCLLKEGANVLALPYSIVFSRSLEQGYFPNS